MTIPVSCGFWPSTRSAAIRNALGINQILSQKPSPRGEVGFRVSDVIDFARLRGVQGLDTKAVSTQISYRQDPIFALRQALNERSEEHTSELQSHVNLVCRLL